ncbi:unnamed protein product [Moneuplotes crassus]|uniref:FAR1 domain-containing protein n=1 Tax=Euplotes crassus TaxID=5936 RepID=A0AAD1X933_EUPCR|nr:unnamed protein product [Moneuplotes crassus]
MNMQDTLARFSIRATFCVAGYKPILCFVDRKQDNIPSLVQKVCYQLALQYYQDYYFVMDSGAIVEDVALIEHDDIIFMQRTNNNTIQYSLMSEMYARNQQMMRQYLAYSPSTQYPAFQSYGYPQQYVQPSPNFTYCGQNYGQNPNTEMDCLQLDPIDIKAEPISTKEASEKPASADPYTAKIPSEYNSKKDLERSSSNFEEVNTSSVKKEPALNDFNDNFIKAEGNEARGFIPSEFKNFTTIVPKNENDIEDGSAYYCDLLELQNQKFYDRDDMIERVREVAVRNGFNICIPRGDITLNDGTQQTTLYCDKYGTKRKRSPDGKERYSKKTGCKWKIKFQKRAGTKYYEMIKTNTNMHNHPKNDNISRKKRSNKLQGKRSHVGYQKMLAMKKLEEEQNNMMHHIHQQKMQSLLPHQVSTGMGQQGRLVPVNHKEKEEYIYLKKIENPEDSLLNKFKSYKDLAVNSTSDSDGESPFELKDPHSYSKKDISNLELDEVETNDNSYTFRDLPDDRRRSFS